MSDLVPQSGTQRASDADRDRTLALLAVATSDGRLTVEEHHDLMTRTLQARTLGELATLTHDLGPATVSAPAPVTTRRRVLSIFGSRMKKGAWTVPESETATAIFGALELDYRQAAFPATEVSLTANSIFGAVELTVPDWVEVVDDGHVVFGAREIRGAAATAGSPRVRLRLRGITLFGAVEVKHKAPKQRDEDRRDR